MKRILKRIFVNFYLVLKIDFVKLWRLRSSDSKQVLLLYPSYPNKLFKYVLSAGLINDFALMGAMISRGHKFRLLIGAKKTYKLTNCKVIHNLSSHYTFHKGENYSESLLNYQLMLLKNNNEIFPSHNDSKYWENKIYMHQKFEDLDISQPKTIIVDKKNKAPLVPDLGYPFLFKPAHSSGSLGIVKINDLKEYKQVISTTTFKDFMLQEWVDMRKDIRMIYIGDELVLHYWRINQGSEWKPTSTGHGSSVDFNTLPDAWLNFIFQEYKKLDIKTGAFDITWPKDDLTAKPLILEVSPSYMPNPAPVGKYLNRPYGEYKKAIWGKDAYYKQYIDLVFAQKIKLINTYDLDRG